MNIKYFRSFLKGVKDSIQSKSMNPLMFQLAVSRPLSDYSDFYLICKIKHEAHLLDKATKNPFVKGRAVARKNYVEQLLSELYSRDVAYPEIEDWAKSILQQYNVWKRDGVSQHLEGKVQFSSLPELSVPSIRFWEIGYPTQKMILECIAAAQMASASCNRQAFLVKVEVNTQQDFEKVGARNSSMFSASPYRVFIFANMRNYSEKYAPFIDMGMFAQNFVLKAKQIGLGTCCCYASEQLELGQSLWRKKFGLSQEFYCGLTILVGYPKELVEKPPRLQVREITEFKNK